MTDTILEAEVQAARAYEALFVPALFGQFANKLVDAANVQPGHSVLDVACGTGVLARAAAQRAGAGGYVAGLDPGVGMLAVAREAAPTIDWRQGEAESIPFPACQFDAVVSQFGLMFMDQVRALREMLRVLRPHGRLAIAVWDALERSPAYEREVSLLDRLEGARAAAALRAPFALGDEKRLAALFESADAKAIDVATVKGTAEFPGIRTMVEADLRGWLPVMGVVLTEERIAHILREAERSLADCVTADERAVFEVQALLVTARKS